MDDVLVVGAGPIGLKTAMELKALGINVSVIEEHPIVGRPVNCTGLVSKTGARSLGLELEECTVNSVVGARIFSPDGSMLEVRKNEPVAYVLDREKFDYGIYKKAVSKGIEVKLNTRLIDVRNETVFVQNKGRGELAKAKIVVGADGAVSRVRQLIGRGAPKEKMVHAIQVKCRGLNGFDKDFVEMHFGSFAKDFFAWVVPESKEIARIGLGTSEGNPAELFDEFVRKKRIAGEFFGKSSAMIPIGPPLNEITKDNLILVGDAAYHTKATSGGGIVTGSLAASIAAEGIKENLANGKPLKEVDKKLVGLNKELQLHWRIRKYLNSLDDNKLNKLVGKANKAGLPEFLEKYGDMDRPSLFVGRILRTPKLWGLFGEGLKIVMG
ncbi:MAG: geranylgeranyl reductase family protein [Candidatus Diapherotrites archaeon]